MNFNYEAYNKENKLVTGDISASGKGDALEKLLKQGVRPVRLDAPDKRGKLLDIHLFESIKDADLIFIIRNLATSLQAGMGAAEALDIIAKDTTKTVVHEMLTDVLDKLRSGISLAAAFTPYKKHFPPTFLGMIEAGERSGKLDTTLTLLGDYLEQMHEFRSRVKSALIYPLILVLASVGVSMLILTVLIPRLATVFRDAAVELPLITRVMIGISDALTYSYILDVIVLLGIAGFFVWFKKTPRGQRTLAFLAIRTPGVKAIGRMAAVVRSARTLGTLLASGVGVLETIELSGKAVGNVYYEEGLARINARLVRGESIEAAFAAEEALYPRVFIGLISVGERTGNLAAVLVQLADYYERDVDARLKNLSALIEPVLILVLGVVVGTIALAVLLPIYGLLNVVV